MYLCKKENTMSHFLKYTFLSGIYYLLSINCALGQDIVEPKSNKWGIKAGVIYYSNKILDSPVTGSRGNGCSVGHVIDKSNGNFGLNAGLFYQKYINQKLSVIFGPEVNITNAQSDYRSSLVCVGGMLRYESQGTLKYQRTNFFIPILIRYETSYVKSFVELGVYHDLGLGNAAIYDYEGYEYYENFQMLPQPKVINEQKTLTGSNYGMILGIGKGFLKSEKIELRLQYYASLSRYIRLDEYRFIRQSPWCLSVSYRF
jgi:hypothetical protein